MNSKPKINKKKNNKQKRRGNRYESSFNSNFPNTSIQLHNNKLAHIVADRQLMRLAYYDTVNRSRGVVGSLSAFWRYRINTLWDPDPLVFTGSVSGLAEWSKLYSYYRVLECRVNAIISNTDPNNVLNFVMTPSNSDISVFLGSTVSIGELNENEDTVTRQCGIAWGGKDRINMNKTILLSDFYGSKAQYLASPNTSAAVNTDPVDSLYINFGYQCAPGALGAQFVVDIVLHYVVEFFEKKIVFEPGSYEVNAKSGFIGPRYTEAMIRKS